MERPRVPQTVPEGPREGPTLQDGDAPLPPPPPRVDDVPRQSQEMSIVMRKERELRSRSALISRKTSL
eukprot:7926885-Pyramimonas_sp.AAC.1